MAPATGMTSVSTVTTGGTSPRAAQLPKRTPADKPPSSAFLEDVRHSKCLIFGVSLCHGDPRGRPRPLQLCLLWRAGRAAAGPKTRWRSSSRAPQLKRGQVSNAATEWPSEGSHKHRRSSGCFPQPSQGPNLPGPKEPSDSAAFSRAKTQSQGIAQGGAELLEVLV